jgi:hypothetical protein
LVYLVIHVRAYAEELKISQEATAALSKAGPATAEYAAVRPGNVHIASTKTVKTQATESQNSSPGNEYEQYISAEHHQPYAERYT